MLHIKKIKPRYNSVLVTGNRYEKDEYDKGIIIASKGDLKVYQDVIAVGSTVMDIKPGDKVKFNPLHYATTKIKPDSIKNEMDLDNSVIKWNLPWVILENEKGEEKECLLLKDNDIEFVYEGYEKDSVPSIMIPPKKEVLLN